MRVDSYLPPASLGNVAVVAARAERLGFDGLFSAETAHDPYLPLSLAAAAAPGLELGTAIALAFPRSPMVTAQTAWDLAALTGGRFILGLGTQVKAHITRRFSAEWSAPVPRLAEYVLALRAIWNSFQTGEPLRFEGEHYRLTLLTPFFDPGPIAHPEVPVAIAGVGPFLARMAGEVCDGFHVHPFHSVRYLDEVLLPAIGVGAAAAGRSLADVPRFASVFVITGDDEEAASMRESARRQIAFYASTPTYHGVLDVHGWDFGRALIAMSKRGEWGRMAEVVTDEVLDEVAVTAPPDRLGAAIRDRYGDRIQRVGLYGAGLERWDDERWAAIVDGLHGPDYTPSTGAKGTSTPAIPSRWPMSL